MGLEDPENTMKYNLEKKSGQPMPWLMSDEPFRNQTVENKVLVMCESILEIGEIDLKDVETICEVKADFFNCSLN